MLLLELYFDTCNAYKRGSGGNLDVKYKFLGSRNISFIMFRKNLIYVYLIMSTVLIGFYIYESIYAYKIDSRLLYNEITMVFVCICLSLLFLSFYINDKLKRLKTYNPEKDSRAKFFSMSLFWICLVCLINYFALIINYGFSGGKILFWQLSAMILGLSIVAIYMYLFNKKKSYYL